MGRKKLRKKTAKPKKEKEKEQMAEKTQRYVRKDKVEIRKKEGWKEAKSSDERMNRTLARNEGDLVLMEK